MVKYRFGREGPRWTMYLLSPVILGGLLVVAHVNLYATIFGGALVVLPVAAFVLCTKPIDRQRP